MTSTDRVAGAWRRVQQITDSTSYTRLNAMPGNVTLLLLPVAAYAVQVFLLDHPSVPWVAWDTGCYLMENDTASASYHQWCQTRGPGYPIFLYVISWFSNKLYIATVVQFVLTLLSIAIFCEAIQYLFKNIVLSVLIGWTLLFSGIYLQLGMFILSEGVFSPLVMLYLGLIMVAVRSPSPFLFVLIGLIAAYSVATRPVGYAIIASIPFLWFGLRAKGTRWMLWVVVPVILLHSAFLTGSYLHRGFLGMERFGGIAMVGMVAHYMDDDQGSPYPSVTRSILHATKTHRADYAKLNTWYEKASFMSNYARILLKVIGPITTGAGGMKEFNELGIFLVKRALITHPWEFTEFTLINLWSMWKYSTYSNGFPALYLGQKHREATDLMVLERIYRKPHSKRFILSDVPIGDNEDSIGYARQDHSSYYVTIDNKRNKYYRVPAAYTFYVSVILVILAIIRWRKLAAEPTLFVVAFASIALHGYYLMVAISAPTLPRYALPYFPVAVFVMFAGTFQIAHLLMPMLERTDFHLLLARALRAFRRGMGG